MSPEETASRRPVWAALSELFLDTELAADDMRRLGDVLARSPYSLRELEAILFRELVPVLQRNLRQPAGEYRGFDQAWLEQQVARRAARTFRWPHWLLSRGAVREPWARLRELVAQARASGAAVNSAAR